MLRRVLFVLLALSLSVQVFAQQKIIRLYEGDAPGFEGFKDNEVYEDGTAINVVVPTLTAYLPDPEKATGAAMVVAPGGAFVRLAMDYEGYEVGEYLADHGVAAFVLKYRTRPMGNSKEEIDKNMAAIMEELFGEDAQIGPMISEAGESEQNAAVLHAHEDGLQAIRIIRSRAAEFKVDPQRIGIMGFSAGAILSLYVALDHDPQSRPALVAPIYTGWAEEINVPDDACPLYLVSPQNDLFPSEEPFGLYTAWKNAGKEAELHIYSGVGHGFGMRKSGKNADTWIDGLLAFMRQTGFAVPSEI